GLSNSRVWRRRRPGQGAWRLRCSYSNTCIHCPGTFFAGRTAGGTFADTPAPAAHPPGAVPGGGSPPGASWRGERDLALHVSTTRVLSPAHCPSPVLPTT